MKRPIKGDLVGTSAPFDTPPTVGAREFTSGQPTKLTSAPIMAPQTLEWRQLRPPSSMGGPSWLASGRPTQPPSPLDSSLARSESAEISSLADNKRRKQTTKFPIPGADRGLELEFGLRTTITEQRRVSRMNRPPALTFCQKPRA